MRLSVSFSPPPSSTSVLLVLVKNATWQGERERESKVSTVPFRHILSFAFALVGFKVWPASHHSSMKREEQDRREERQKVPRARKRGREDLSRNEILKCRNAKRWKRARVSENETAKER